MSKIEWSGDTWHPVTGYTGISEGYRNCYAEIYAWKLQAKGGKHKNGVEITLHEEVLRDSIR